jgi:IgA-specific serine endopeptidase
MSKSVKAIIFALLLTSINFISAPAANAGCQDYPESTTPACIEENLAIERLRQEAYAAEQIRVQQQAEQAARDNAARIEAERAATAAADNALAPDDCARSTNRATQRCADIERDRAAARNAARNAAEIAATAAADSALAPDDCARSTNKLLQRCVDAAVAKAVKENLERDEAEKAAIKLADAKLAANDCARSTNRFLQSCIDAATAKAAAENASINAARELEYIQSIRTRPVLDENGQVILTALLRSKSLSSKDIKAALDSASLSADDKKSLAAYAQSLNNIKGAQGLSSLKIPLSKSLSEEFSSSTPKICAIVDGAIKTLKSGSCVLSIKFATESGFEIETTKKIAVRK